MSAAQREFLPIDFRTRFPALDGLRGLAVTMVFLEHYGGGSHGGAALQAFNQVRSRMGVGVDLFFVLSGFLITGILFDTRQDSHFFERFFARRSLRIFPVVYLLFAVLALLTPLLGYRWQAQQAWFLVYLGNFFANARPALYALPSTVWKPAEVTFSHLWSLCVEEQFYLLWPLVVWSVRDRVRLLWVAGGLCLGSLAMRVAAVVYWEPEMAERWLKRSLPFKLDALLFGAMLALLLRSPAAGKVQRGARWAFVAGLAGMLLIAGFSPGAASPWDLSLGMTTAALMGAGLVGMALRSGSAAYRLFGWRPLRALGRYSYGFYVYHLVWRYFWIQVLVWLVAATHSKALGGLLALPLGFLTTFLLARLSYHWVEVRFLRLKRHFQYDSEVSAGQTAFAADGN